MLRRVVVAGAVSALVMTVACWPTTRYVGVNFRVSQETLPLWMKAADFIDRDVNLSRTARAVLGGVAGDEAKAAAALAWTRSNIRPVPVGFPVVDDHVWHIIVRGYGPEDQRADVFTTLLAYAGVPAYWMVIGDHRHSVTLSYARIGGRWRVHDVSAGIAFRNAAGELATPEEIAANHELVRAGAAAAVADVDGYVAAFEGYAAPQPPDALRADLQRPGRRWWHETRKLFGMQGREWQMRAAPVGGSAP
jgi:hypothetical protein